MSGIKVRDFVISLSLANIFFFSAWRRLIFPADPSYNIKFPPSSMEYSGMLLSVLLLASVFTFGVWLARKLGPNALRFVKFVFLITVVFSLGMAFIMIGKTQFWIVPILGRNVIIGSGLLAAILAAVVFCIRYKHLVNYARAVLLILAPLVLVTFAQAIIGTISHRSVSAFRVPGGVAVETGEKQVKTRVVWILFDELDYHLAFESRPKGVELPELDRFAKQSIYATAAHSPSRATLTSIPALFTGRRVVKAEPNGPNELMLTFDGQSQPERFSSQETIFSDVRNLGGRTAIVGWYHPYCRVLPNQFDRCMWETRGVLTDFYSATIPETIAGDLKRIFNALPREVRNSVVENREYIGRHQRMMAAALEIAADPKIDLAFVHLPFPHAPYVYNRRTQRFTGGIGYVDNLVLTDRMLGKLRRRMEQAGVWDSSVVIVTSDHQFRVLDKERTTKNDQEITRGVEKDLVPFMIKLDGQDEPMEVSSPLNTILTRDLIRTLITEEIESTDATSAWLYEHTASKTN